MAPSALPGYKPHLPLHPLAAEGSDPILPKGGQAFRTMVTEDPGHKLHLQGLFLSIMRHQQPSEPAQVVLSASAQQPQAPSYIISPPRQTWGQPQLCLFNPGFPHSRDTRRADPARVLAWPQKKRQLLQPSGGCCPALPPEDVKAHEITPLFLPAATNPQAEAACLLFKRVSKYPHK